MRMRPAELCTRCGMVGWQVQRSRREGGRRRRESVDVTIDQQQNAGYHAAEISLG